MAAHWFQRAIWALLVTALTPGVTAAGQFKHVRSDEAGIRTLVADGYERSATLRKLIDDIEGLPGIVYISEAVKLSQGMDGALLHIVTGSPQLPILRVVIKTNLAHDYAIAIVAHELHHVSEALHAGTRDADAMAALFRSLDTESETRKYETEEAKATTSRVLAELRARVRR